MSDSQTPAGADALRGAEGAAPAGSTRRIVVVDVETSGLDPDRHVVLEVAVVVLSEGFEWRFVPNPGHWRVEAAAKALELNRYFERGVFRDVLGEQETARAVKDLEALLEDSVLAGANPAFDAAFLTTLLRRHDAEPAWHHRLLDLSAYAAGVLDLDAAELPGLSRVCELLGVENTAPHTALGDARATADCLTRLMEGSDR